MYLKRKLKSLYKVHNATTRDFDVLFWNSRIITSYLSVINVKKWSYKKDFSTVKDSLLVPEKKVKVHETRSTMKEEKNEEKSKSKLNFKSLLNYKRKITVEIVPESNNKRPRAIVDLKLMEEELKQLQDPPITAWEKQISSSRLPFSFYDVPCKTLAKNLLGKVLVRKLENGTILKGRIVETESYLGVEDKASHTFGGKVTQRNIPMYMPPGTIYVYFTYGMYHCFNISSQEEGSAVLVRAVEPTEGIEQMAENRSWRPRAKVQKKLLKELKVHELCNGPSKICMAMRLEKVHSRYSLCDWKELWIEDDSSQQEVRIIECPRIGIENYGPEWANKPLRFYIYGHKCISKRDKKAEAAYSNH